MMLFAADDSNISIVTALAVVTPIVVSLGGVAALLFRALMLSRDELIKAKELVIAGLEKEKSMLQEKNDRELAVKEAERKEEEALKKIYMEVGAEAIRSAFDSRNEKRKQEGKPPLSLPVAIVPEGQSPPTAKQLEVAKAGTMRAALAKIKLDAGQEARKEPGTSEDFDTHLEKPQQSDAIKAVLETQAATGVADDKARHATELAVKLSKAEKGKDAK